jgi:D-alanyl-D-alanine carboxypeptidase
MKVTLLILLFLISGVSYGRHAAILLDADNGSVLHEVEATHSWYPASLTKVMTLYMTFDALTSGQVHLYDIVTASRHASLQPNSKLGLRQGERLTVQEAILATITRSANDAAVALAEHIAGSEENFAVKMTAKAHTLGMYDTHFMNATGLPHDWQVTTARDMVILAWKIQRNFPSYYPFFSSHSFNYKGTELRGINKFTASYPGAEGMKTGFTCGSGYNLISSASQNGRRLIGVVLGGMTSPERYQLMVNMMDAGFNNTLNVNQARNINALPTRMAGSPPYQLGCGNRMPTQVAANSLGSRLDSSNRSTRKPLKNSVKIVKASHKVAVKPKHSVKSKLASKSKTVKKPPRVSKGKSSKTRYHH